MNYYMDTLKDGNLTSMGRMDLDPKIMEYGVDPLGVWMLVQ